MRDLIDIIVEKSQLMEKSRGLLYRSAGDEFFQGDVNAPTAVIVFDKAEYYPGQPGAYADAAEMSAAAQKIMQQYPDLTWTNQPRNSRAFAILTFKNSESGQDVHFGRFFQQIQSDMTGSWKNNELPGNWQLNKASSLKGAYYKLKPSDLFPPGSTYDSPADLMAVLSQNEKLQPLMAGMQQLMQGHWPVFQGQKAMESAIRDDLGEIIGPMALVMGMITDSKAESARRDILGPRGSWAGSQIHFPASKTNGLVDSVLFNSGKEIGISSKGEKGATASIKNVADGIAEARTKGMKKLLSEYAEQIEVIDAVGSEAAKTFPLTQGKQRGMLTDAQASLITDLIKNGVQDLDAVNINPADREALEDLMSDVAPSNKPNYNVGYHAMAGLARRVVAEINQDPKFGEACLTFLNTSPILQLHMKTSTTGDDVGVTGFTVKYPPEFEGTVALDATKVYYSTGVNGRCTFAYNGGPDSVADARAAKHSKQIVQKVNAKVADIGTGASMVPGLTPQKAKSSKTRVSENLGRARRS